MKKERLLILFSKWPRNGNSKSRIAKILGGSNTEKFCFACLDDLIGKMKSLNGIDFIVVPNTAEESSLFTNRYGVFSLSLESLGILPKNSTSEAFYKLFNYFLKKYKKISLIPMDIPHIDQEIIENSFRALENYDYVFGPEENGGVYLIGLNKLSKDTFNDIRWSTENSFNDLMKNCESSTILTMFFDLNTINDLISLNQFMLAQCPCLKRFIKSLILDKVMMKRETVSI
jgi:uncharacterized protein